LIFAGHMGWIDQVEALKIWMRKNFPVATELLERYLDGLRAAGLT
jgi:hypothetical protein